MIAIKTDISRTVQKNKNHVEEKYNKIVTSSGLDVECKFTFSKHAKVCRRNRELEAPEYQLAPVITGFVRINIWSQLIIQEFTDHAS
jgi:hypothetical protein